MTAENNTGTVEEKTVSRYLPAILLGLLVGAAFLVTIFSFQVRSTERAIVTSFGHINDRAGKGPGIHLRWPYPVQQVHRFDIRPRCFDGSTGKIEEVYTADGINLVVSIFINYRIEDPAKLYTNLETVPKAEDALNDSMRTAKDGVFGSYRIEDIFNTDPEKARIDRIEDEIRDIVNRTARSDYGIEVLSVGIKSIVVPGQTSGQIFTRMIEERNKIAADFRSKGKSEAQKIRDKADSDKSVIIASAEAEAKKIRAEGDAKAAEYYSVFNEDPELAAFLRKLDSLKKTMGRKTTIILDTETAPFDILKPDSMDIGEKKDGE